MISEVPWGSTGRAVVGRVLKIYTQVKVKLLPSKSTLVKVNIPIGKPTWVRVKKYFVLKLLKLQVTLHFCIGVLGSVKNT